MNIGEIKKIGIALAAFKPEPSFFVEQLKSIQNQTFLNWICVVTCDSSIANLLSAPTFKDIREDLRFVFIENEKRLGHKKNFEKALNEVLKQSVDAIAFSDQDDVWYPEKLTVSAQRLADCPSMSLVHSDMHVLVGKENLSKTAWQIERRGVRNIKQHHLLVRNVVAGCSILMDVNIGRKFSVVPEGAPFHDHWYALVSSSLGVVEPIHQPLYAYRQHENNVLAVTPFRGVFRFRKKMNIPALVNKMKCGFLDSRHFAKSAEESGLKLNWISKLLFLNSWDCGLSLMILGAQKLIGDQPLARACWARSCGKLLTLGVKQKGSL
jgi:rhamnosyltransferase